MVLVRMRVREDNLIYQERKRKHSFVYILLGDDGVRGGKKSGKAS